MRFRDHVADQLKQAGDQPRSVRTRLRLKLAAIDVLEETSFVDARTIDIAARAETSVGTFYTYFEDKKIIAVEIMTELVRFLDEQNRFAIGGSDPFAVVLAKNMQYVRVYGANAGLLRCLQQLCDSDPDFQRVWNDTNHRFSRIFADGMARRLKDESRREMLQLVGYALAAMIDELMRLVYVVSDPRLTALVKSPEYLAEVISVLWYRALYGRDPARRQLRLATDLLDIAALASLAQPPEALATRRARGADK